MPIHLLSKSARRVAAVSVAAIVVIGGAGALSVWRYQVALSRASTALDERTDAKTAVQLTTDVLGLSATPWTPSSPIGTGDVGRRDHGNEICSGSWSTQVRTSSTPAEAQALAQAVAAEARLLRRLHLATGRGRQTGNPRVPGAVNQLEAAAPGVVPPLTVLVSLHIPECG